MKINRKIRTTNDPDQFILRPRSALRSDPCLDAFWGSEPPTAAAASTFVPDLERRHLTVGGQVLEDVIKSSNRGGISTDPRLGAGGKLQRITLPLDRSEEAVVAIVIGSGENLNKEDSGVLGRLALRSFDLVGEPSAGLEALAGEDGFASGDEAEGGGLREEVCHNFDCLIVMA